MNAGTRRVALLLSGIVFAQAAHACVSRTMYPAQQLARRASVVVEGVATGRLFEMNVTRIWKGNAAGTVRLGDVVTDTGDCNSFSATVEGRRYVFFIDSLHRERVGGVDVFPGRAEVWDVEKFPEFLRHLETPVPLTKGDLLRMLRGWEDGKVADEAMWNWIEEMTPVADTDDWETAEECYEWSHTLATLISLQERMNGLDPCRLKVIRERVLPMYIRLLVDPSSFTEDEDEDLYEIETKLCRAP